MSQIDDVHAHLLRGKPITPIQALNLFGCFRLAAVTEMVHRKGKKWASYTLTGYNRLY